MASHDNLASQRPSRRQVAKGASWAAPVLTTAALAPRVAATPAQCTPESQNDINRMVASRTSQTYPLQINFWQLTGTGDLPIGDGIARNIWVNLRNDGPGARALAATPANPIVVQIVFRAVPGSWTGNRTRRLGISVVPPTLADKTDWGTFTKSGDEVGGSTPVTYTWTIDEPIPVRTSAATEADLRIAIAGRYDLFGSRDPLIYATATMTSFGPNDDLTASSFASLSTLGLGAQTAPCTDFYNTQVNANVGSNKATYTLSASGGQLLSQPWTVGSTVDTRTIGNFAGIAGGPLLLGQGEGYNGIW